MNTNKLLQSSRRWTLSFFVALLLALATVYSPVVLQEMTGVAWTTTAYACGPQSGGGGC